MNILFYTSDKISPTVGGTEHTALTVAEQLTKRYGCRCYAIHSVDADTTNCDIFKVQQYISYKDLRKQFCTYLLRWKIDVVLSEGSFEVTSVVNSQLTNRSIRNIFVHHFTPGWEVNFFRTYEIIQSFKARKGIAKLKDVIKLILFPILKIRATKHLPGIYYETYQNADKVVLLSSKYIPLFQAYGKFNDTSKFVVIPNAISFNESLSEYDIKNHKDKIILVVSRLEEVQKRISLVLKIWEKVHKDKRSLGWKVLILGEGQHQDKYERYIKKQSLEDIYLLGRQDPIDYYKKASIFMMTSKSEGFPLTLGEAMQNGCVPMAFDSFASLSDIITNDYNGIIIPECDQNLYVKKLLQLMEDENKRYELAINGIRSCNRYSKKNVAEKWWALLNE